MDNVTSLDPGSVFIDPDSIIFTPINLALSMTAELPLKPSSAITIVTQPEGPLYNFELATIDTAGLLSYSGSVFNAVNDGINVVCVDQ